MAVQIAADGSATSDPQRLRREATVEGAPWSFAEALQQRALEAERSQSANSEDAQIENRKANQPSPETHSAEDAVKTGGVVRWSLHVRKKRKTLKTLEMGREADGSKLASFPLFRFSV